MEENDGLKHNNKSIEREYKSLAKNSFYSFIHSYSRFFYSIITSFIMGKIFTQETWGFLIIALSIIAIFSLTLTFLPPSLGLSFNYYIPRYRALNQNNKLKSFIQKSLIIRLLFVIPIFLISLLIIYILTKTFYLNLGNVEYLLILLSPLVIIDGFYQIFSNILRSYNLFKIAYYLLIIRSLIHIGGLIFILLNPKLASLQFVSLIIMLSFLIPTIINFFIILRLQMKIRITAEEELTFKQVFKRLFKYGSNLSLKTYLDKFNREFKTIFVGRFTPSGTVTGYNIGVHYSDVSFEAIGSFNRPLTISFSSLGAKKQAREIEAIYKNLFQYALFLILIITGILFLVADFYLQLIYSEYSESFALYSTILKILIISMIFNVQGSFFYSLLRASEKVKYFIPIGIISFLIQISCFFLGLQYFGITGGVFGVLFGNVVSFVILSFLNLKIFNFKIDVTKTILTYTIFFCALGLSLLLETLFFAEFNTFLLQKLNITIFRSFNLFSLFSIFILNIFSISDIERLELIFNRDNFIDKTVRKSLNFLKKLMRRDKN
jgi:O-antigen/teichoic acid export membrane protein